MGKRHLLTRASMDSRSLVLVMAFELTATGGAKFDRALLDSP